MAAKVYFTNFSILERNAPPALRRMRRGSVRYDPPIGVFDLLVTAWGLSTMLMNWMMFGGD